MIPFSYAALECDGMTERDILGWAWDMWFSTICENVIGHLFFGEELRRMKG